MQELSPLGKLFFGSLVAWIIKGSAIPFKIRGTPEQVKAITDAAFAARRLHDELKKPDATIQTVLDKLNEKNKTAENFKNLFGFNFPA
jgi:hypothetical protein